MLISTGTGGLKLLNWKKRLAKAPISERSGSYSMDRYWRELDRAKNSMERGEFVFTSLLKDPPENTREAGRWLRAGARYMAYPLRAVTASPMSIFHLLARS